MTRFISSKFKTVYRFWQVTPDIENLHCECDTKEEFEAVLKAEEVQFDTNESHSYNQLPLLQS